MILFPIYASFMHKKINEMGYKRESNLNKVILLNNYSWIITISYDHNLKNIFVINNFYLKNQ
ncbi:hypothetical protein XNC1_2785 [Xenorhabdus nematophila ATCC 19061]|uniref:Uncharacterized protein n=1 Tax=Xenorhabdus nematophila (strain ATCC 19061 / DSM 3370 / CCUG 14189 / LMG 1036 / NCIMB 9965 / AN6) TaxID=406817 RepID=D3VIY2_XENNA|nr:hypothetical protein XNC1_2785 [Xenorhabdus nematophila ATCC 19061]CEK23677.1 hypothetical protein XNC2_2683 [Xenorhabdus nematophila AN6/1]